MKKGLFPAIFLIIFMIVFSIMAVIYAPRAISKTESPTLKNILIGTWAPTFEANLNESFPVFEVARNFWGRFEYRVFGQGRKGVVVVGSDGWLFTDEEFSCITNGAQNMAQNLTYISGVSKVMQGSGVELNIILIPSKARIYSEYLGKYKIPVCRDNLYSDALSSIKQSNISVVSLLEPFQNSEDKMALFLKTDTHWSPLGAELAALYASIMIDTSSLDAKVFLTTKGDVTRHEGDLLRYLPGVDGISIERDLLPTYETQEQASGDDDTAIALFSDNIVPITLVGTSYSANPAWNFHGFLKDEMDVDILNMADEGLGPFAVMDAYLSSDTWKNTPPSLVIWEIPERYLTTYFKKE